MITEKRRKWSPGPPAPTLGQLLHGTEKMLFSYSPDELSFEASEFIGLTEEESRSSSSAVNAPTCTPRGS